MSCEYTVNVEDMELAESIINNGRIQTINTDPSYDDAEEFLFTLIGELVVQEGYTAKVDKTKQFGGVILTHESGRVIKYYITKTSDCPHCGGSGRITE